MTIERTGPGLRITLSFSQRQFLYMLACRGRRILMNTSSFTPTTKQALEKLKSQHIINMIPILNSDRVEFYLEDLGVAVVAQMEKTNKQEIAEWKANPNFQAVIDPNNKEI